MKMGVKDTVVRSRVDGAEVKAHVILCPECGSDSFHFFVLEGGHDHMQCTKCDETYCDGSCATEGREN